MKFISASILYLVLFGTYLSMSGAPIRVHIASAISLSFGFLLPALIAGSVKEIKEKKAILLAILIGALFIFDFLNSLVVVKAEFLDGIFLLLPIGLIGLSILLMLHVNLTYLLERLKNRKVEPIA